MNLERCSLISDLLKGIKIFENLLDITRQKEYHRGRQQRDRVYSSPVESDPCASFSRTGLSAATDGLVFFMKAFISAAITFRVGYTPMMVATAAITNKTLTTSSIIFTSFRRLDPLRNPIGKVLESACDGIANLGPIPALTLTYRSPRKPFETR